MDSFELNKLIGAFLAVVFVAFSVSLASDAIFATHAPEQAGYHIEAAEPGAGTEAPAETGPSVLELLATADPAAGEQAFRKCAACHTPDEGGANRVGPNLWDIVNRPIASHEGFNYSAAMRDFSQGGTVVWDFEHLSQFLRAPRSYVSGTAMAFAGIRNPQEEANLLAYLHSLSDNPAPLPEPEAAPAEGEGEAAPAEGAVPAEEAAPAEEGAPAQEQAPAEQAPQPDTQDDGTSAAPQPDSGTGAGSPAPGQEGSTPPPANQ